jgi:uncharacterized protein (UPF0248 family)
MKPIHEIINRIRWDKVYADADFLIGYYDRLSESVMLVPFKDVYFDDDDHSAFQIVDDEGVTHNIPMHRVRSVYKNGQLIWHR